jgi:hypothetical protein
MLSMSGSLQCSEVRVGKGSKYCVLLWENKYMFVQREMPLLQAYSPCPALWPHCYHVPGCKQAACTYRCCMIMIGLSKYVIIFSVCYFEGLNKHVWEVK